MDEKSAKQRKNKVRNVIIDIATLFVVVTIAIAIFIIVGQQRTSTSTSSQELKIVGLHCERPGADAYYFERVKPVSGTHQVTAAFKDDNLQDLMYSFVAVFADGTNLDYAKTAVHADFDLDLGNKYVHGESGGWSEDFSIQNGNSVLMTVSSGGQHLSAASAHVFGLPKNSNFPTTLSAVRSAYESAGYACTVND